MIASSSADRTVDFGSLEPVGRSATDVCSFYFATFFRLMPYRFASDLRLSLEYVVSIDGTPLSWWRFHGELGP